MPMNGSHTPYGQAKLTSAAINDLRDGLDAAGVDTKSFDRDALNRFGIMLLRAHLLRFKIEARRMQKHGKDAIIDT